MKLRGQLTLGIASACLIAIAGLSALFFEFQNRSLEAAESEKLSHLVAEVRALSSEALDADDPFLLLDHLERLLEQREEIDSVRVRIKNRWSPVGGRARPPTGLRRTLSLSGGKAETWGPKPSLELNLSGAVLAQRRAEAKREALKNVLLSAGLAAVGSLLMAGFLGGRLSRRIHALSEAVEKVGSGDLGLETEAKGRDEIGDLARKFNAMSRQLSELEAMKKTFISSVTHELRSPLGAIESYVRLLLSGQGTDEDRKRNLRRILENANRLQRFVTTLLDLAKIEQGKLDLMLRPCRPGEIVRDTADFFAPKAKESGLMYECVIGEGIPEMKLDPDMIGHALTNLISNALKFTPVPGSVYVRARLSGEAGKRALRVEVADTGVGISDDEKASLFKTFSRIENATRTPGTGLGLVLAKQIVQLHGGAMGVDSKKGEGSCFWFEIPLRLNKVATPSS